MQVYLNQSPEAYGADSYLNDTTSGQLRDKEIFEYTLPIPLVIYRIPMYILVVIGVPANLLLLFYLFRSGKYRTTTFCTITSLALADFVACLGVSLTLVLLYPEMPLNVPGYICPMLEFCVIASIVASSYHLHLFSVIRFYQLIYPLKSKTNLTLKLIICCCLGIWITSVIGSLPFLWFAKSVYILDGKNTKKVCNFYANYQLRDILFHIIIYVLPISTMITLHIIKFVKLNKATSDEDLNKQNGKGTVHKAMYMIIISFLISWIPAFIHDMVHEAFGVPYRHYHMVLYHITNIILVGNNCANPYIYMLMAKPIRDDILSYICIPNCQRK